MSASLLRRDIFDPGTIRAFAEQVGTPERLKLLCLFTYADIRAVNPEALTSWKAESLWQLYVLTANYLSRSLDEERFHATRSQPICSSSTAFSRCSPRGPRARSWRLFSRACRGGIFSPIPPEEIAAHFRDGAPAEGKRRATAPRKSRPDLRAHAAGDGPAVPLRRRERDAGFLGNGHMEGGGVCQCRRRRRGYVPFHRSAQHAGAESFGIGAPGKKYRGRALRRRFRSRR